MFKIEHPIPCTPEVMWANISIEDYYKSKGFNKAKRIARKLIRENIDNNIISVLLAGESAKRNNWEGCDGVSVPLTPKQCDLILTALGIRKRYNLKGERDNNWREE